MNKWLRTLICVLALLCMASCASTPFGDTINDKPFVNWFMATTQQVKADPRYQRIPLDTTDQSHEFVVWMHALYRQQMTPAQFEQQVDAKYPGHSYESHFIVQCLPPPDARPPASS